jgi:hypothetical protein
MRRVELVADRDAISYVFKHTPLGMANNRAYGVRAAPAWTSDARRSGVEVACAKRVRGTKRFAAQSARMFV